MTEKGVLLGWLLVTVVVVVVRVVVMLGYQVKYGVPGSLRIVYSCKFIVVGSLVRFLVSTLN